MKHNPNPNPNLHTFRGDQRGVISIMFALLLTVLLGISALAVDIAYLLTVKNQLQNAADAAAMAGANYLYANGQPNWDVAVQKAREAVSLNTAAGHALTDATVTPGYWNPTLNSGSLQQLPVTPTVNDVPAIQVELAKSTVHNGGEVGLFFAKFLGINNSPVSVRSVSGRVSPGTVDPGSIFPIVMSQCMFDTYWNYNSVPPGPAIDPVTRQSYIFRLGTATYSNCSAGQWTSLNVDNNSAAYVKKLITSKNPIAMSVGDMIWVQPGSKTSNFDDVNACSYSGNKTCEYVSIPVARVIDSHHRTPISAFACIRILRAVGASSKFTEVQMSTKCEIDYSGGVGPGYGVVSPSSLLQ